VYPTRTPIKVGFVRARQQRRTYYRRRILTTQVCRERERTCVFCFCHAYIKAPHREERRKKTVLTSNQGDETTGVIVERVRRFCSIHSCVPLPANVFSPTLDQQENLLKHVFCDDDYERCKRGIVTTFAMLRDLEIWLIALCDVAGFKKYLFT
jgi:hypothetical protein